MSSAVGLTVSSGAKTLFWSLLALVVSVGLMFATNGAGLFSLIAGLSIFGVLGGIVLMVIAAIAKAGAAAGNAISLSFLISADRK